MAGVFISLEDTSIPETDSHEKKETRKTFGSKCLYWLSTPLWDTKLNRLLFTTTGKGVSIRWVDVITGVLGLVGVISAVSSWVGGPSAKIAVLEDKIEARLSSIENRLSRVDTRLIDEMQNRQDRDLQISNRINAVDSRIETINQRQHEGFQRLATMEAMLEVKRGR